MMLTDPAIVRRTLGFDDISDVTRAIESILDSATAHIASILNTSFDKGTAVDTFFVEYPTRQVGHLRQTEFRLSKGFVREVTRWEYVKDLDHFGTSEAQSALSNVITNTEKGLSKDIKTNYMNNFVRVTYTYGLSVDDMIMEMYDETETPNWLQEAAKVYTLMHLGNIPAIKAVDDGSGGGGNDNHPTNLLRMQFDTIMGEHSRYAPLAHIPVS